MPNVSEHCDRYACGDEGEVAWTNGRFVRSGLPSFAGNVQPHFPTSAVARPEEYSAGPPWKAIRAKQCWRLKDRPKERGLIGPSPPYREYCPPKPHFEENRKTSYSAHSSVRNNSYLEPMHSLKPPSFCLVTTNSLSKSQDVAESFHRQFVIPCLLVRLQPDFSSPLRMDYGSWYRTEGKSQDKNLSWQCFTKIKRNMVNKKGKRRKEMDKKRKGGQKNIRQNTLFPIEGFLCCKYAVNLLFRNG